MLFFDKNPSFLLYFFNFLNDLQRILDKFFFNLIRKIFFFNSLKSVDFKFSKQSFCLFHCNRLITCSNRKLWLIIFEFCDSLIKFLFLIQVFKANFGMILKYFLKFLKIRTFFSLYFINSCNITLILLLIKDPNKNLSFNDLFSNEAFSIQSIYEEVVKIKKTLLNLFFKIERNKNPNFLILF